MQVIATNSMLPSPSNKTVNNPRAYFAMIPYASSGARVLRAISKPRFTSSSFPSN